MAGQVSWYIWMSDNFKKLKCYSVTGAWRLDLCIWALYCRSQQRSFSCHYDCHWTPTDYNSAIFPVECPSQTANACKSLLILSSKNGLIVKFWWASLQASTQCSLSMLLRDICMGEFMFFTQWQFGILRILTDLKCRRHSSIQVLAIMIFEVYCWVTGNSSSSAVTTMTDPDTKCRMSFSMPLKVIECEALFALPKLSQSQIGRPAIQVSWDHDMADLPCLIFKSQNLTVRALSQSCKSSAHVCIDKVV